MFDEAGTSILFAHAPSTVSSPLPVSASILSGRFGFRPGACAPENAGRTDRAELMVSIVDVVGQCRELFRRGLRPFEMPEDRGEHEFAISLSAPSHGAILELEITAGPAGNAASDWTYWSELNLKTSR